VGWTGAQRPVHPTRTPGLSCSNRRSRFDRVGRATGIQEAETGWTGGGVSEWGGRERSDPSTPQEHPVSTARIGGAGSTGWGERRGARKLRPGERGATRPGRCAPVHPTRSPHPVAAQLPRPPYPVNPPRSSPHPVAAQLPARPTHSHPSPLVTPPRWISVRPPLWPTTDSNSAF